MNTRILFIEPEHTRKELLHTFLAENAPTLEYRVVSSLAEAQSQFDGSASAMVFAAQPASPFPEKSNGNAGTRREIGGDSTDGQPEEMDCFRQMVADLSHDLRGSLGIILNAAFLLKRKGAEDPGLLEKYLDIIEQEATTAEHILSDRVRSAQ